MSFCLLSADLEVEKADNDEMNQQLKLKVLTETVQMLSWTLQQNLVDLHFNFTPVKTLEQINYKNRKAKILSDYDKLCEQIKNSQDNMIDKECKKMFKKLGSSIENLQDLCVVAEGKRKLWNAEHEFRRYNYEVAISDVQNLRKELRGLKLSGDLIPALKNLCSDADNQLSLYIAQLSIEWEAMFSWSQQRSLYHQTYSLSVQQSDPILMKNVMRALHTANRLNYELSVFSSYLINDLLHNLIRNNCEIFTDEQSGAIIFNIKIDLTDKTKPSFHTIFNNLTAVFEFLQSTLDAQFESDERFISILAQSLREEFFNKIIDDCIKAVLPTCETTYENYKNLVMELDSFNKFLIDLKFVEPEDSPLKDFMDTEAVLYKKRHDKLLNDVRLIMKESLSHGTVSVGVVDDIDSESTLNVTEKEPWDIVNKPLFLPKCVVSQNVKRIMIMLMEHLADSAKLPEKYSNQLVLYIKDVAFMYQWLVPKQFKVNLESCPLDIALFFNNCFYLAHGLLGPSWRNVLPFQLADNLNIILIECMHDLRILGLEKMSLYLQKQKDIISKNILTDDNSTWTNGIYREFNSAVAETLAVMKDLKCSWLNVLPTRMYDMSMCTLIQALCQCMIVRLLTQTHYITEDIILLIRRTFDNVLTEVQSLFEEEIDLEKKVNNWNRFVKMSELLKAHLLEISELWNDSKDLSNYYTCEEVRRIIKIRFPDNNVRLRVLAEIQ